MISEPIARWQNLAEFGRWRALAPSQSIPLKAITQVTRISNKHIGNLLKRAVENGYRADWVLLNNYLKDKPRVGRKKKITSNLKQKVINAVICDRYGRKRPLEGLLVK